MTFLYGRTPDSNHEPAQGCNPVHPARFRSAAAGVPGAGCFGSSRFRHERQRSHLCGHLPAPVRQERAPGADRDLSAHHLFQARCRDRQGQPHLEAAESQRHAPPGKGPRTQHPLPFLLGQAQRLYIRSGARPHRVPVGFPHLQCRWRHGVLALGV